MEAFTVPNTAAYIVWAGFLPSGNGMGVGDGGSVGCRPTDSTRLERRTLTDSFGFGPQLCGGTAPLPAVRTRGREKVREGGGGREGV